MRESRRRQNLDVCGRPHRYGTRHKRENKPGEADETVAQGDRLELALEIGLEDTFPASDPVAVVQPGRADETMNASNRSVLAAALADKKIPTRGTPLK